MAPTDIGPYSILRLIKRGGGGSVYVAHDQRLNRKVALKFITVPRLRETRERVVREARMLASISHRFVVQVFDVVEVHSHVILVMEYVPGTDLENLLANNRMDGVAVLQLGIDICSALAAAHQAGIVHRDLKPENILVDNDGHIKLTDFGIAHYLQDAEREGVTLDSPVSGSYQAMSPEQAVGSRLDARSDLFALGLLLYRLLSGRHPFADSTNELQVLQRVINVAHEPLMDVAEETPPRLSRLVDELLNKDPQQRPASALAVRQELLSVMRDMPLTRGNLLSHYVAGIAREEDLTGTGVELPAGFSRGARSHLLSDREWGPWVFKQVAASRQSMLILVGSGLFIGMAFAVSAWLDSRLIPVVLETPRVIGDGNAPSASQLEGMLKQALASDERYRTGAGSSAERLSLQVNCNLYVCGMELSLRGNGSSAVDYRAFVPGSSAEAWKAGISESLDNLAEED
jgi:hypothetical protein